MPKPSAAELLIARLNEIEQPTVANDDSGEWKTLAGWMAEWEFEESHTRNLIRRARKAGLMETRKEFRRLSDLVSRSTPVYRMKPTAKTSAKRSR